MQVVGKEGICIIFWWYDV